MIPRMIIPTLTTDSQQLGKALDRAARRECRRRAREARWQAFRARLSARFYRWIGF